MSAQKDNKKEDLLAPTEIKQDNNPENSNRKDANLSHSELQERLGLYGKIGGEKEPFFTIENIKKHYLEQIHKRNANRNQAAINYGQGKLAGLPHKDYEIIKEASEQNDKILRNKVAEKAKETYEKTNSLSKSFAEKEPKQSEIKKAFERAKNNLNKEPYPSYFKRSFEKNTDNGKDIER